MKKPRFREGQAISIVWGGQIRLGRIRRERDSGTALTHLVLDVRGMPVPLLLLPPEDEGRTWARGHNGEKARALASVLALSDTKQPTFGAAAKNLFAKLGQAIIKDPDKVVAALTKAAEILAGKDRKSP